MLTFPSPDCTRFSPLALSVFPEPAKLLHQDLLRGPSTKGFGTRVQEVWRKGKAAGRRIAALRAVPGGRYVEEISDRRSDEVVVTYPKTLEAPPIEARKGEVSA